MYHSVITLDTIVQITVTSATVFNQLLTLDTFAPAARMVWPTVVLYDSTAAL